MNKPKGKSYGSMVGTSSGVESGLSEVSKFKSSEGNPPEEAKTERTKEENVTSRRMGK